MEADAFGQLGWRRRSKFNLIAYDRIDVLAGCTKGFREAFRGELFILRFHSLFEVGDLRRVCHDSIDDRADFAEV